MLILLRLLDEFIRRLIKYKARTLRFSAIYLKKGGASNRMSGSQKEQLKELNY